MRFSTFVAFTLPFSALAAPLPVQPTFELDITLNIFAQGLIATSNALNATIQLAQAIRNPPQQDVIDGAVQANENIRLAGVAVERIGNALAVGQTPTDPDLVESTKNTLEAQTIINNLAGKIKDEGWHGKRDGHCTGDSCSGDLEAQLQDLRERINDAVLLIGITVNADLTFLALQGRTVRVLFLNAGLDVPLGF